MYHIYSIKYCHVYKIFHDSSAAFILGNSIYLQQQQHGHSVYLIK